MKYLSSIILFFIAYAVLAGVFEFGETTSVILALIGAALFYSTRKEKQQKANLITSRAVTAQSSSNSEEPELERDHEFGGVWGAKPRQGTEARAVQEEVKKIKKVAEDKGVKELISELYFENLHYYPHWIQNSRESVPVVVSEAIEEKEKGDKNERDKKITKLVFNGKAYKFAFQENSFSTPDGEWHTHGLLELFTDDERVLAINVSEETNEYSTNWSSFGIEAFIEGPWIEDFQSLKKAIAQAKKERALKEAEDPKKTAKLKKDFGIK